MGRIVHGNKNFGYAPINFDSSTGTYSFGTPVMLPGLVNTTIEVEQETTGIPADDNPNYATIKGAKVRSATASFRHITSEYLTMLGMKQNASNGFITDTGIFASHCIFFTTTEENEGVKTDVLHYLYKVVGSEPTKESTTDTESIEAREIQVSYTASQSDFVKDADNEYCQYAELPRTTQNASLFDTFKTKVLLPTDVIPTNLKKFDK